jgi:hypothetical protein
MLRGESSAQRLRVARWLREDGQLQRRVLPDEFGDGCVFDRYFATKLDNPLVVIDQEGKIACTLSWTAAERLDGFLSQLVARGGKWDPTLTPPGEASSNSGPSFKDMMEHLGRPKK